MASRFDVDEMISRIGERRVSIGVVGLGYVGLPLALTFCENRFQVVGFDVDASKVERLERGETYIVHLGAERVRAARASERFRATTDLDRLTQVDAIIVAVPTPLTRQREPDMRYVVDTMVQVRARLQPGQIVILESTTYPGTSEELVCALLEASGLRCGEDFFVAYSPEREDPGNQRYSTATTPKVVGGVGADAARIAQALYQEVVEAGVVLVSSSRVAEATKLTENIFRAVNIALVNELKVIYDRMGIDVWEVLDAAETKPFGFMRFNPGPGIGGHCIPLDPFYLTWKAREHGVTTKFIELAGEVNLAMPSYVISKLQAALNLSAKPLKHSRVMVLGLSYKPDIDDPRESPSFELLEQLFRHGAEASYHDPHIPRTPAMRSWPHLPALVSAELSPESLRAQDAVVIATAHTAIDYEAVLEHAPLIIDTRGVFRGPHAKVVKA